MLTRRELDHVVLDVEFVIISVVQGVALTTLAVEAAPAMHGHDPASWAFVVAGLMFVLAFWSAALVHSLSFVSWPMDLVRYFFYFTLALFECLTFQQMARPHDWFGWSCASYALCLVLYARDHAVMRARRVAFESSEPRRRLFAHMLGRQRLEMALFVPAGLAFCAIAWWWTGRHRAAAVPLAWAQVVLTFAFVVDLVRAFGDRQRLITAAADTP